MTSYFSLINAGCSWPLYFLEMFIFAQPRICLYLCLLRTTSLTPLVVRIFLIILMNCVSGVINEALSVYYTIVYKLLSPLFTNKLSLRLWGCK